MYPFGTLPDNLIAFSRFLRHVHAFRIGPGEIHDAARALEIVDLTDERTVRDALRPILSGTLRDATIFDRAFTEFFFPGPPGVPQSDLPRPRGEIDPDTGGVEDIVQRRLATDDAEAEEGLHADGDAIAPLEIAEHEAAAPALGVRSSYSPFAADSSESPELTSVDAQWRDAARSLVRRLRRRHLGLTRRWRLSARGRRFDLRRTLRASLQTGGEPLTARWLRRPRRTPRLVLLVDGSRSMSEYARTALTLGVAIATSTTRVEVFTFSTALQRVTGDVRRAAAGETRRLERLPHAWAGGTSIGACLGDFLRRFGDRMVGRDTVVMIASDGLDVGAPDMLRDAMRDLHRRSAGVVWLNPLLETPGYEPTACGMRAARPYISTFASVNDAASLARLSRMVHLRAR
jgi:hypothetical protein